MQCKSFESLRRVVTTSCILYWYRAGLSSWWQNTAAGVESRSNLWQRSSAGFSHATEAAWLC